MAGRGPPNDGASSPPTHPNIPVSPSPSPRVLSLLPLAQNALQASFDNIMNLSLERTLRQQFPGLASVSSHSELAQLARGERDQNGDRAPAPSISIELRSSDGPERRAGGHSRNPSRDASGHSRNHSRDVLVPAGGHSRQPSRDMGAPPGPREADHAPAPSLAPPQPLSRQGSVERDIEQGADDQPPPLVEAPPQPQPQSSPEAALSEGLSIDFASLWHWTEAAWPFLLILIFLFLYVHRNGLLLYLWEVVLLIQLNAALVRQVALREGRKITTLLGIASVLAFNIFATFFFLSEHQLWRSYLMQSPVQTSPSIWHALWVISVNDVMVRYVAVIVKALVTCVYYNPNQKRRSQVYVWLEIASQLYRTFLPIPVWVTFYNQKEFGHLFKVILVGLYLVAKLNPIVTKARQFASITNAVLMRQLPYGRYANADEARQAGDQCSICQEKYKNPVVLACTHLFCEDCISEWFARNNSCPLCRSVVRTVSETAHGDGSTSLMLTLF